MCITFLDPLGQFADCSTHVDEGVEVLVQALVSLPLQSRQSFKVGPVEGLPAGVVHHPVGRHCAVEVCLLSTSPPSAEREDTQEREVIIRINNNALVLLGNYNFLSNQN